jgi:hypothetical protein
MIAGSTASTGSGSAEIRRDLRLSARPAPIPAPSETDLAHAFDLDRRGRGPLEHSSGCSRFASTAAGDGIRHSSADQP